MSRKVVKIRNRKLEKQPRIFDVVVDEENGNILRFDIQNIKGEQFVDGEDMREQIREAIDPNPK